MNTISFDWVRIIALMPFRESETTSNRHRTINYVYLGFSLCLMVLIPVLRWKGISCLNDVADLELSLFAPLPAMWGLGLPIQCFGKKDGHHKRGEIIIPDTHSSSPHSSRECQGEDGRRVNVNVFNFHINLLQNYFLFNFRQSGVNPLQWVIFSCIIKTSGCPGYRNKIPGQVADFACVFTGPQYL